MKARLLVTTTIMLALWLVPHAAEAQPAPSDGCPGTVFTETDLPFADTNITNGMHSFRTPHSPAHTCAAGSINPAVAEGDDVAYQFTPLAGNAGGCQVTFNGGEGHVIVTDDPNCGIVPYNWQTCVFEGTGTIISFNFSAGTDGTPYQLFIDLGTATTADISCWPTLPVELYEFTVH